MPQPTIFYVRHGLTEWNLQDRLQGRHDVPLNKQGRAQAIRCAEILHELLLREGRSVRELDYVSSPLIRARETMELMRAALGLDRSRYEVDGRLAEIAFGEWEGLTYAEILARDKDGLARRESDKWLFLPPGGESYAQVSVRVRQWYDEVRGDTVVAAHGGTGRALVAHLAIAAPEEAAHYPIEHGVVYVLAPGAVARYS